MMARKITRRQNRKKISKPFIELDTETRTVHASIDYVDEEETSAEQNDNLGEVLEEGGKAPGY